MSQDVRTDAAKLIRRLKKEGMTISFAESCTGGLLASTMTDNAGASEWFNMSFITYSNESKMRILGVEQKALEFQAVRKSQVLNTQASMGLSNAGMPQGSSQAQVSNSELRELKLKLARKEKENKELKDQLEEIKKNGASKATSFDEMQSERD